MTGDRAEPNSGASPSVASVMRDCESRPDRFRLLSCVLLFLSVVAAYSNIWHAPFIYDDIFSIVQNKNIQHLWPVSKTVAVPAGQTDITIAGRPVAAYWFALNHAISDLDPWSYHATNIAIHACSALLLLGIARRTLR